MHIIVHFQELPLWVSGTHGVVIVVVFSTVDFSLEDSRLLIWALDYTHKHLNVHDLLKLFFRREKFTH